MFRPSGPIGAFSTKISLGYMIGLYSLNAMRNLERLKDIRNDFAHELRIRTFSDVRDACANLANFEQHFHEYGTQPPEACANPMLAENDLSAHLADPKQRFLMCVRLYSGALTLRSTPPGI
jgi:hypothetical protein